MPKVKKATAPAVSQILSAARLTKSAKYKVRIGYHASYGFKAQNETTLDPETRRQVPTGRVHVSWVSGNYVRLQGDAEQELAGLTRATEILAAAGFVVETDTSPGGYLSLIVTRPASPTKED